MGRLLLYYFFLTATCADLKAGETVGGRSGITICGILERDFSFFFFSVGWVNAHRGHQVRILIFPSRNREGVKSVSGDAVVYWRGIKRGLYVPGLSSLYVTMSTSVEEGKKCGFGMLMQ